MNKTQKFLNSIFIFSASALLLLTGCSKQPDYKILENLHARPFDIEDEKQDVKIGIKVLSEKEFSNTFFAAPTRRKKQVYNEYKIMLVDFANKSDYLTYLINPQDIGFSFANSKEIFEKLKIDKKSANSGYFPFLISSLLLGPITVLTGYAIFFISGSPESNILPLLLFFPSLAIITTTLLIGVLARERIKKEIKEKNNNIQNSLKNMLLAFDQTEEIGPNTGISKLFFINKKNIKPEFTINLLNQTQQSYLEFNIPYLIQNL